MVKTFRHGGKMGDVIFSLPAIRELGGGILYLPENTSDECKGLYSSMENLLLQQSYISEVREYPSGLPYGKKAAGIHVDYDLDEARNQSGKGVIHIVRRYLDAFNLSLPNWKEPWLTVKGDGPMPGEYVVINYTGRHILNEQMGIKSRVDWIRVHNSIPYKKYFVGTIEEYRHYFDTIGMIDRVICKDVLEIALLIKEAKAVYCNQSLCLALAQSLGVKYHTDFKPGKTNCMLFTNIEHAL